MRKLLIFLSISFFMTLVFPACGNESGNSGDDSDGGDDADLTASGDDSDLTASIFEAPLLNPSGNIPLSAEIVMKTAGIAKVVISIADKDADKPDYAKEYSIDQTSEKVGIPILGLFPDYQNSVTATAFDKNGAVADEKIFKIQTAPLPKDFPSIEFSGTIESGWTAVNWLRTPRSRTEMNGIALDEYGRIRWFTDLPYAVCFPLTLRDDTFYCGGGEGEVFVNRYDFMGYQLESVDVSAFGYKNVHHEIFIKPDGNYLIAVDKADSDYIEDRMIEIDPEKLQLRGTWNLNDVFPDVADLFMDMRPTSVEIPGQTNNPIHHNAILYDDSDNSLIVSSQTAGIVKLSHSGHLKWYLAPHLFGWIDDADGDGKSDSFMANYDPKNQMSWVGDYSQNIDGVVSVGEKYTNERAPINGIPYQVYSKFEFSYPQFFLTPLDKNGNEIKDLSIVNGLSSNDDFAWPFRMHNPTILKNGNLMLFDNGLARDFAFPPISPNHYSRVVEYKITPDADGYGGTIQQIWEYKLEDDPTWYSMSLIVSGANELENGNRLIVSGSLGSSFIPDLFRNQYGDGPVGAFVIEVDPSDNSEKNRIKFSRYIDQDYPINEFSIFRAYRFELAAKPKNRQEN